MWARNIVQIAYGVPGILAYFLVFYAIRGVRKALSMNFIVIYVMMAVSNILTWLNAWLYLKLTDESFYFFYYDWLKEHSWIADTHHFLCSHFYYVQNIDLLIFTFDRFACVISMTKDVQWWKMYYLPIIILIHIGFLILHLILINTRIYYSAVTVNHVLVLDNNKGKYDFPTTEAELVAIAISDKIRLGFGISVWLACLILNALSRYFYKLKMRNTISAKTTFLLLSLCIFLTQFLNIVVVILLATFSSSLRFLKNDPQITYVIMYFTSDLFSIGPAIYTILLPGPIREFLILKIRGNMPFRIGLFTAFVSTGNGLDKRDWNRDHTHFSTQDKAMDDNSAALMAHLRKQTSTAEADKNNDEKDKSCGMYRREYFSEDYTQHGISDMCREMEYDDSTPVEEVVCRVDEVPEGGMHEVELRGRKIVVIRDKGKFSAVNGLCAHYNWPLINGYYSNGKIRCQLHGACFNTGTGDIEDYPTFDGLHPFNVRKMGENLVISTTEKRLGSDRHTKPNWIRRITTEKPIIIIGGGPAAQSVAENLRVEGSRTPIIMMSKESITPYDRVLLSKRLDAPPVALRTEEFYTENHIVVRLNSEVTSIDPPNHSLTLADGSLYEYSKVIIATGGKVRKLRNEGAELKGIHTLRNHEDPPGIMADAKGEDVVCIGASFIGTEAACALISEAKSVTVICTTAEPIPALGEQIGKSLRLYFEGKGIKVITNARVSKLTGADGRVKEVHLVDGTVLPARCVVAGIGVDPDTKWMAECGIDLDKRGFVKVDDNFLTNRPDVYAIGDCVSAPLLFFGQDSINIQHFQTAQKHGQLAARSILHKPMLDHNIPFFWAMFFWMISIRFAGVSEGHDSTVLRGDTDSFVFVQYYFKDNRVIAVCSAGPSLASIQFESMCSRKISLTREMVENAPDDNLSIYLK